jgi:hypothetical protein
VSEFTIRASSFGSLFDCPHRWEGVHVMGMRMPSSPRAAIGQGVHAGTAAFDRARIDGKPMRIVDAGEVALEAMQSQPDVDWNLDPDLRVSSAESLVLAVTTRYCSQISPNYEFVEVETTTKPLTIDCGGDILITLTGTLDRARVRAGSAGVGISDVKTGLRAVSQGVAVTGPHRAQIGTYELLLTHTTGQPITLPGEVIGLSTSGNGETAVGEVHGARDLLVGTEDYPGLIEHAATMFRSGLFYPNPKSSLCSPRYCARWATCRYHE